MLISDIENYFIILHSKLNDEYRMMNVPACRQSAGRQAGIFEVASLHHSILVIHSTFKFDLLISNDEC